MSKDGLSLPPYQGYRGLTESCMNKDINGLALLRKPFEPHHISKLPKPYKKDSPKGNCRECGGYHGLPAVHLSYVGHAALTDRLLDCDPAWTWEPLALDDKGCPVIDSNGGLWIKLTVCGVTRLGYGDAQGKTGGDAMKERIGDALRNAAMRFGAALELWHKGELHPDQPEERESDEEKQAALQNEINEWVALMEGAADSDVLLKVWKAMPNPLRHHPNCIDAKDARKAQFEVSA